MVHRNEHQSRFLRTVENYQYKQANLEDNYNPSTSPIVTLEYVVVNSTVVPDPCAWARI